MEPQPRKLLDRLRDTIRLKHYSYSTEKTYVNWNRRYILFHNKRHPQEMGAAEIEAFLTYLAVQENVAASTQNQALNAIVFLYHEVLKQDIGLNIDAVRAKRCRTLPTVLTKAETQTVLQNVTGIYQLVAQILYGSGLRLNEALCLRVKDVDFAQRKSVFGMRKDGKVESRCSPRSSFRHFKSIFVESNDCISKTWIADLAPFIYPLP